MRDWQDKETEREAEIDDQLRFISTEDLVKAVKRRQEAEIQEKVKQYEAQLREQLKSR